MQSKDPKGSSQQAPFTSKIMGSILASDVGSFAISLQVQSHGWWY